MRQHTLTGNALANPGPLDFSGTASNSPDGIVLLDGHGLVLQADHAAAALLGRPAEELIDRPFGFPVAHGGGSAIQILGRPGEACPFCEMQAIEMEWQGEPVLLVLLWSTRRHGPGTDPLSKERSRPAPELTPCSGEHNAVASEDARRALEKIGTQLAHDFNNALTPLVGFTDLLLRDEKVGESERARAYLHRMQEAAKEMTELVHRWTVRCGRQSGSGPTGAER